MRKAHQHQKTLAGRRDDGNSTLNRIRTAIAAWWPAPVGFVVGLALLAVLEAAR